MPFEHSLQSASLKGFRDTPRGTPLNSQPRPPTWRHRAGHSVGTLAVGDHCNRACMGRAGLQHKHLQIGVSFCLGLQVSPPGIEWKTGQNPKMGKNWPKNAKRPKCPEMGKKWQKWGKNAFSYFFAIYGPFVSHFEPWAVFSVFGPFFPIFGFRPVFHSISGGLTRKLGECCDVSRHSLLDTIRRFHSISGGLTRKLGECCDVSRHSLLDTIRRFPFYIRRPDAQAWGVL